MADIPKEHCVKANRVFIQGKFDETIVEDIIFHLPEVIEKQGERKDGYIEIYINSGGGEVYQAWQLVSLVEMAKQQGIKVKTFVFAYAFSAGSMLAVAGSSGERYVSKNTVHLCHLGKFPFTVGTDLQLERTENLARHHFNCLREHYEKYCDIPDLDEKLKDDGYYVFGKDIIKFKMADKFIE